MSKESITKSYDFWVIVGLLVVLMGFMFSMNARMATKADIARVEANIATKADKADVARVESDIKEIRTLFIGHIGDSHKHRKQKRDPASESAKSKSK